jgi:hypothetical protein
MNEQLWIYVRVRSESIARDVDRPERRMRRELERRARGRRSRRAPSSRVG